MKIEISLEEILQAQSLLQANPSNTVAIKDKSMEKESVPDNIASRFIIDCDKTGAFEPTIEFFDKSTDAAESLAQLAIMAADGSLYHLLDSALSKLDSSEDEFIETINDIAIAHVSLKKAASEDSEAMNPLETFKSKELNE